MSLKFIRVPRILVLRVFSDNFVKYSMRNVLSAIRAFKNFIDKLRSTKGGRYDD